MVTNWSTLRVLHHKTKNLSLLAVAHDTVGCKARAWLGVLSAMTIYLDLQH